MKIGIVCEGGGMRGVYTSGVLQAFMNANFEADLLVGVSAGASNGASYVSRQSERGMRTNLDYVGNKQYLSLQSYLRTGSVFGMDYVFGEIPEKLDPFDFNAFYSNKCDYFAGATDVHSGRPVFFGKQDITPGLAALRASCSMPMLAPIVMYNGGSYLDGGISDPIPLAKALQKGCDTIVVILTRARGYQKKPQSFRTIYHSMYRKYPNLVRTMDLRHLLYNHTLERLWRLEAAGKAIVIAPTQPLTVGRFGQDRNKLSEAYKAGLQDGTNAFDLHPSLLARNSFLNT